MERGKPSAGRPETPRSAPLDCGASAGAPGLLLEKGANLFMKNGKHPRPEVPMATSAKRLWKWLAAGAARKLDF